jgi:hypothetical protein
MDASGQLHALIALPPEKEPMDRKLCEFQSLSGRWGDKKNLAAASNRTPAVQHLSRHYTALAIPPNL